MDSVRFGRALGFGARQAIKTVAAAVDAATAEKPAAEATPKQDSARVNGSPVISFNAASRTVPGAGKPPAQTTKSGAQARSVSQGVARGSRRLGEAVWGPFARLGGVLWLEVSGVFFGIFALMALGYVWKLRGAWPANAASHRNLIGAAVIFALFGYFCISNFVRARRRERGR